MSENRSTGPAEDRFRFPWWGSILLAIVCYCTLKYLVPLFQPTDPTLARLVHAAPFFAPIVAIPLLLLAAKQLYDTDKKENEETDPENEGNGDERKD